MDHAVALVSVHNRRDVWTELRAIVATYEIAPHDIQSREPRPVAPEHGLIGDEVG